MGIKLSKEWNQIRKILDPRQFTATLQREVGRATGVNAALVAREIRSEIKATVPPANEALTMAIKGSSKPLVDKGTLWQAITFQKLTWNEAVAGLIRGRRRVDDSAIDLAKGLHDGVTMKVTDKMRGLFQVLANASSIDDGSKLTGRAKELWDRSAGRVQWKPLNPETTVIVIKSRPFILRAIGRKALVAKVQANWAAAVQRSLQPRG